VYGLARPLDEEGLVLATLAFGLLAPIKAPSLPSDLGPHTSGFQLRSCPPYFLRAEDNGIFLWFMRGRWPTPSRRCPELLSLRRSCLYRPLSPRHSPMHWSRFSLTGGAVGLLSSPASSDGTSGKLAPACNLLLQPWLPTGPWSRVQKQF